MQHDGQSDVVQSSFFSWRLLQQTWLQMGSSGCRHDPLAEPKFLCLLPGKQQFPGHPWRDDVCGLQHHRLAFACFPHALLLNDD